MAQFSFPTSIKILPENGIEMKLEAAVGRCFGVKFQKNYFSSIFTTPPAYNITDPW